MILAFVLAAFEHKSICIYKSDIKFTKVVEQTDNFGNFVFKDFSFVFCEVDL